MDESERRGGFFKVDNRIVTEFGPRIGLSALGVYLVLSKFADNTTGTCYPSLATIGEMLGVSRPTVKKAIRTLKDAGMIAIKRRPARRGGFDSNEYALLRLPDARETCGTGVGNVVAQGGEESLPGVGNDRPQGGQAGLHEQDSVNNTRKSYTESVGAKQHNTVPEPLPTPAPTPAKSLSTAIPPKQATPAAPGPAKRGGAAAPPPPRDPNLKHPAVQAYRDACKLTPNERQRAEIAATVEDITRWEAAIGKWLLTGYRKSNVEGMLDWYKNGVPGRSQENGNNGVGWGRGVKGRGANERYTCSPRESDAERARLDAEWESVPGRDLGGAA